MRRAGSSPDLNYQVNCGIRTSFLNIKDFTFTNNISTRTFGFVHSNVPIITERVTVGETSCVGVGSEDGPGEDELAG